MKLCPSNPNLKASASMLATIMAHGLKRFCYFFTSAVALRVDKVGAKTVSLVTFSLGNRRFLCFSYRKTQDGKTRVQQVDEIVV